MRMPKSAINFLRQFVYWQSNATKRCSPSVHSEIFYRILLWIEIANATSHDETRSITTSSVIDRPLTSPPSVEWHKTNRSTEDSSLSRIGLSAQTFARHYAHTHFCLCLAMQPFWNAKCRLLLNIRELNSGNDKFFFRSRICAGRWCCCRPAHHTGC